MIYNERIIDIIWEKAHDVPGYDKNRWRKDFAGAWIQKDQIGIQSDFGWEIDHLVPISAGGSDDLSNLAPLHWKNNETKGTNTPIFKTSISSDGIKNIYSEKIWKISQK